jgi:hypothetical protein
MLTITAADFIEGFAAIGDFLRRPPRMEASMTCKDNELVILVEGMEIGIPVFGHFEGMAWMSGVNIFGLAQIAKKRPPAADVMIDVSGGTIRVDSTTVPLRFESTQRPQMILVPKDAPLLFWLRLPNKFTQEEIAGAGLAVLVAKAIRTRDGMVEKSAKHLAPLGIKRDALQAFVEDQLKL